MTTLYLITGSCPETEAEARLRWAEASGQLPEYEFIVARMVAALVEVAGGSVTIPRRLLVDPPDVLVSERHDLDGDYEFRTRKAGVSL